MPRPRFPLFPPDAALSLSPAAFARLRALAAGALDDVDAHDPLAVAEALFTRAFAPPFADLLDDVARLSDEAAREAILEAAIDRGAPRDGLLTKPAADVGARLARRALRDEAARAIASRARVRLARRLARRAWYEQRLLAAERPASASLFAHAAARVHGGDVVRVFVADTEDGVLHAAIVHRGPATRVVTHDAERGVRARLVRPLACDVVRWDAVSGRVAFQLARPALLADWKDALVAANGAPLYDERLAFTLKPLHERGAPFVACVKLPHPVRSVEVVACELDDGTRFSARGPDALAALHERLGHGGYVYRATLRFVIDGAPRPVDATIELPDKLLLADPRWEPAVRAALGALGLDAPGAIADDLASLAPFVHPEWRWKAVLGEAGFARAVAAGLLARAPSRRAGEARHRVWGSMYTAHDLEGEDARYAVADDPAARAHTVKPAALAHFRLDEAGLAEALRRAMALDPAPKIDAPRGTIALGALATKSARLVFFLLAAVVPEAECAALREAIRKACAKGHTPVVLVGGGRTLHGGIAEVEVTVDEQLAAPSVARAVPLAAEAAGVEDEIEAWRWSTPDAPLVLMREAREAWLGRVRLAITAAQFDGVAALAAAPRDAYVEPWDLGRAISPNAQRLDQIARKTLGDLEERVARSFAEAGVELPEAWRGIVEMKMGKGYRLGVGAVVR